MHIRLLVASLILLSAIPWSASKKSQLPLAQGGAPMVAAPASAATPGAAAQKFGQTVHLEGQLKAGEAFESEIGGDLVFRLAPSHEPEISGWTIEIHPRSETPGAYMEYIYVVTPPYRSSNARYLDTSYGITAKEAVAWTPRTFYFVLDANSHKRASDALNILLWPYNYSEGELDAAGKVLDELSKGEGELRILDSKILEGRDEKELGKIEQLKFAVELKFPPAKETK